MTLHVRIQATSDAIVAAWNAHDVDALAACYAPDADIYDAVSKILITGSDMIRTVARERISSFPDLTLELTSFVNDGTASAAEWIMRITHTHEYQGLAPTGNRVEVIGATFATYDRDGLVTRDNHYVDVPGLLRQLGVH